MDHRFLASLGICQQTHQCHSGWGVQTRLRMNSKGHKQISRDFWNRNRNWNRQSHSLRTFGLPPVLQRTENCLGANLRSCGIAIPTEMFTRQIRYNLKSVTVKIANAPCSPQNNLLIFKSVIPTGDLALFSRHTRTLVGKFARITDPKFRGI